MQSGYCPKVSIVVPVYNVEPFLDQCIQSIVDQTLRDIEIILVDDGSTDRSGALCDEWAKKDARIRVLHKANGGLSDARNAGIEMARAPWIGFVDSDDYIAKEMYERLLYQVEANEAQVAVCGVYSVYANRVIVPDSKGTFVFSREEALRDLLGGQKMHIWVPVKLYSRELFDKVRFPVGKTYEDMFVIAEIFSQVNRAVADMTPLYYYVHHEGTITSKPFGSKSMDIVDAVEHTYQVVERECPEVLSEARFRLCYARFMVLDKMLMDKSGQAFPQQKEVVSYLRKNWRFILSSPYVGKGRKVAMLALRLNVGLYSAFVSFYSGRHQMNKAQ